MTLRPEEWARIRAVFESALSAPADSRNAYIASACGDDADLKGQVESLLASHERATGFLTSPAWTFEPTVSPSLEGLRLGPYMLTARIGAGGMGEVYKARDTRLDRWV